MNVRASLSTIVGLALVLSAFSWLPVQAQTVAGSADSTGCIDFSTDMVIGVSGSAVQQLQEFLRARGHFTYPQSTGYYGGVTQTAVEAFQKAEDIVHSGTPATTGFGIVGPRTRDIIRQLTCIDGVTTSSTDSIFNDLYNSYEGNFSYELNTGRDYTFDYQANFDYQPNFDFGIIDRDYTFDYQANFDYQPNFSYQPDTTVFGDDNVAVRIGTRNPENGEIVYSYNRELNVEVATRNVEIFWESRNADSCSLSGDFPDREIPVPLEGSATVYMVNPSGSLPVYEEGEEITLTGLYGRDTVPLFKYTVYCREDETYGGSARDTLYFYIDEDEYVQTLPAPSISGVTPSEGSFGGTFHLLGTRFGQTNTITLTHNGTNASRTIGGVRPNRDGSISFTFPGRNADFRRPNNAVREGETGAYKVTVTSGDNNKTSNVVTIRIRN